MPRSTVLQLPGDIRVVVPDSLHLLTPYVLFEQQDWFEHELEFVRKVLRRGERAVDIGANYGVYALSAAMAVGPSGHVWAFEPASSTAACLTQSIQINRFRHLTLEISALSDRCGTANLLLHENSEFNALTGDATLSGASESVQLVTLDDALDRHGWRDIAFLKIDAEGEEARIIRGGSRFFDAESPLVLYEVKAGERVHLELVDSFASLGFDSYRLVPGLMTLVPFERGVRPDGYLLNLLCCRKNRAATLADRGMLVHGLRSEADACLGTAEGQYGWRQALGRFPYAGPFIGGWGQTVKRDSAELEDALACYALSRDESLPTDRRYAALDRAFRLFKALTQGCVASMRLASFARVASAYGYRSDAVEAINKLLEAVSAGQPIVADEPFLAPNRRFEQIPSEPDVGRWLLASVLEEVESLHVFSSFYSGEGGRERLKTIEKLGFGSDEMRRRLQLVNMRFPK